MDTAEASGLESIVEFRRQETLIKAGALQDAIFNSANFSSIATDARGVIQIFNVGAERMLGYTAAETVDTITPADISDPQEVIARAEALSLELGTTITPGFEALVFKASRGIEDIYELTYIRKDGSRFPAIVSVTALRDAHDVIIGYLLIGTDNTARMQVEAAKAQLDQRLRDQQFYTRSLIESNTDALVMTDPTGIITDLNQQMVKLTGRSREELIGTPFRNCFTDPDSAERGVAWVLRDNTISDFELTVRRSSGVETVVSFNAATFRNREGEVKGIISSARDVDARRRVERALEETNLQLEHASRMKSEFLATMSHELRTPLNAIIGFSEALKDGLMGSMSDTQTGYIGDIFTSGLHLLALINDILDLSKVEAGMMSLEMETVDLARLLKDSLSIVKDKAAAQHIRLDLDADESIGLSRLDMRKTKQIVYNLLSNAVKFSGDGGRVVLSVRRVPRAVVGTLPGPWPVQSFELADSEHSEFLEIRVSDAGIGISRENMARLFQAFSQIDSSLARKFAGTGLGLAMVKQLAELHAGTVAVSSAEGQGACFAVWLPLLATPPMAHVMATTNGSAHSAAAMRSERMALVVEDNDKAADLVRLLLEAEGFTVLHAASAEAALVMAPMQTLSLVTLDLELPGMDGREFLLKMRESADLAHLPVVIIAGVADSNVTLSRGAVAAMQKPISRADLKATLASLGLQPGASLTRTVLVVDDDPKAVDVIAAFLPTPAYAVLRAYGGEDAIALAQRVKPDIILLDLSMPETNGIDVVDALYRNPDTADIPIVVVTASPISTEHRAALDSYPGKALRVIEKREFGHDRFVDEVRRALSQD